MAILSDAGFDATTVDADSVRFGITGTEAAEVHEKNGNAKRHVEDVDKDGLPDMVFHFRFGDTGFSCADIPAQEKSVTLTGNLTGTTNGGMPIVVTSRFLLNLPKAMLLPVRIEMLRSKVGPACWWT